MKVTTSDLIQLHHCVIEACECNHGFTPEEILFDKDGILVCNSPIRIDNEKSDLTISFSVEQIVHILILKQENLYNLKKEQEKEQRRLRYLELKKEFGD